MSDDRSIQLQAVPIDVDAVARLIKSNLDQPIALVGMMGAGKSKLGRMLSRTLDLPLLDVDQEIEKSMGLTIAEMFDRLGESAFRSTESKIIRDALMDHHPKIIATGGGAVMNDETADRLWSGSISIWVRTSLPIMVERTSRNKDRPLLAGGNVAEKLKALMDARYPVYEKADLVVESHEGPATETLHKALIKLNEFLT